MKNIIFLLTLILSALAIHAQRLDPIKAYGVKYNRLEVTVFLTLPERPDTLFSSTDRTFLRNGSSFFNTTDSTIWIYYNSRWRAMQGIGGGSDGNNFPSSLSFSAGTLTMPRTGLSSLTATINTTEVPEGTNQYFTNARARSALSNTGLITYNSSSGAIGTTITASDTGRYGKETVFEQGANMTLTLRPGSSVTIADTIRFDSEGGGGGSADLGYTPGPTNGVVTNSSGADATLPAATNTNAGLLTAAAKKQYDSAYKSFYNAFAGDTSVIILGGVVRPYNDGSGNITWDWIFDGDHPTLNFSPTVSATGGSGIVTVNFNQAVVGVHTMVTGPDDQLVRYGVDVGQSVGLSSASLIITINNTWGGYVNQSGSTYDGTGMWASNNPSVSYNSTTGAIDLTIANVIENSGLNRDMYKVTATSLLNGYNVMISQSGTTNTNLRFYMYDMLGNVVTGNPPTGCGFQWTGPTWRRLVDTEYMGGSNSWLANIFDSLSNIWIIAVLKKN